MVQEETNLHPTLSVEDFYDIDESGSEEEDESSSIVPTIQLDFNDNSDRSSK